MVKCISCMVMAIGLPSAPNAGAAEIYSCGCGMLRIFELLRHYPVSDDTNLHDISPL